MQDSIITLSLCGRIYKVPKLILLRSEYFKNLFDDFPNYEREELYIARSPLAFDHILAYLIDDTYEIPDIFEKDKDYFLIQEKGKFIKYKTYGGTHELEFNISNRECLRFGFKHRDRVKYKDEIGKVIGVYDNLLYFHFENDSGATYFGECQNLEDFIREGIDKL